MYFEDNSTDDSAAADTADTADTADSGSMSANAPGSSIPVIDDTKGRWKSAQCPNKAACLGVDLIPGRNPNRNPNPNPNPKPNPNTNPNPNSSCMCRCGLGDRREPMRARLRKS